MKLEISELSSGDFFSNILCEELSNLNIENDKQEENVSTCVVDNNKTATLETAKTQKANQVDFLNIKEESDDDEELVEKGPIRQREENKIHKYKDPYPHAEYKAYENYYSNVGNSERELDLINNNSLSRNDTSNTISISSSLLHSSGCTVVETNILVGDDEALMKEILTVPSTMKEFEVYVETILKEEDFNISAQTISMRKTSTDTDDTAYGSMDSPEPESPKRNYREIQPKPNSWTEELKLKLEIGKKQKYFVHFAQLSDEQLYQIDNGKTIYHKLLLPKAAPDLLEALYSVVHLMKRNNPTKLKELLNVEPKFVTLLKEKAVPWAQLIENYLNEVIE